MPRTDTTPTTATENPQEMARAILETKEAIDALRPAIMVDIEFL